MAILSHSTIYKRIYNNRTKLKTSCPSACLIILILLPIAMLFFINFFLLFRNSIPHSDDAALDDYIYQVWRKNSKGRPENAKLTEKRLVCYYNYPKQEMPIKLFPSDLDCNLCTHINVAFGTLQNKTIVLNDILAMTIQEVVDLKKCNKQLKVLLSIGGAASDSGFPEMIENHASRKVFIRSVRDTLKKYKMDGIDLDWEFPVIGDLNYDTDNLQKNRQRQHFSQLLREIRMEYFREKRDYLLTVAVGAINTVIDVSYDVSELNQYVDFVNLMSYDYHSFSRVMPFTGFNAPLYKSANESGYLATLNVNFSVQYWLEKGLDAHKLVVGLPTYGHTYSLVNSNNGGVGSPANGFGKLGNLGFVNYYQICDFLQNSSAVVFDNNTMSPYLHMGYDWVSYDNEDSLTRKTKYIKDKDVGGVMVYSLNADDFSMKCSESKAHFPLTRIVRNVLFN